MIGSMWLDRFDRAIRAGDGGVWRVALQPFAGFVKATTDGGARAFGVCDDGGGSASMTATTELSWRSMPTTLAKLCAHFGRSSYSFAGGFVTRLLTLPLTDDRGCPLS